MPWIETLILALIQGITEFLPVSSSAHLLIAKHFWLEDISSQVLMVSLHFGSLLAVLLYFRARIIRLAFVMLRYPWRYQSDDEVRLGWHLIVATIPVVLIGLFLGTWIEIYLYMPFVIVLSSVFFGLLLWFAFRRGETNTQDLSKLSLQKSLLIGFFQALALIPGASRSGIVLTAGLLQSLKVKDALTFSFLLSIPAILGASVLYLIDLVQTPESYNRFVLFMGFGLSFLFSYLCIRWLFRWIETIGVLPFVIYRLVFAGVILGIFYL